MQLPLLPNQPSSGLLKYVGQLPDFEVAPCPQARAVEAGSYGAPRGNVRPFLAGHLIASLRHAQDCKSDRKVGRSLTSALRWWLPHSWKAVQSDLASTRVAPSKQTLQRSKIQLDAAAMLAHRRWYTANGPSYRYIAYDASPQRGVELFVTVERVVLQTAVSSAPPGVWPAVHQRLLPLTTLGHGRMSVADKMHAHVHQAWLEYGPSVSDVRKANLDVRQCLSDMGAELNIVDSQDSLEQLLGEAVHEEAEKGWLFRGRYRSQARSTSSTT